MPVGATVSLTNALVTGRASVGFFLQVKETDPGYAGPDNSGIFVCAPGNAVSAGDRVSISRATVADYYGQIQLGSATVMIESSAGEAPPAPITETPANVGTGGARASALEAVIVRVADVTVTDVAPPPGPGETAPTSESGRRAPGE